jgi:O-antigen/teichoic acid export membrane protein
VIPLTHGLKMMLLGIFLVLLSIFCVVFGWAADADMLALVALLLVFLGILCFVGGFFNRNE